MIFSTGGEGGGVTHNGACNNEYLRITFWANVKNGGRGGGGVTFDAHDSYSRKCIDMDLRILWGGGRGGQFIDNNNWIPLRRCHEQ